MTGYSRNVCSQKSFGEIFFWKPLRERNKKNDVGVNVKLLGERNEGRGANVRSSSVSQTLPQLHHEIHSSYGLSMHTAYKMYVILEAEREVNSNRSWTARMIVPITGICFISLSILM